MPEHGQFSRTYGAVRRSDYAPSQDTLRGISFDMSTYKPEPPQLVQQVRYHRVKHVFRESYADDTGILLTNVYARCQCGQTLVIAQEGALAEDEHWEAQDEIDEAKQHFRSLDKQTLRHRKRPRMNRTVRV